MIVSAAAPSRLRRGIVGIAGSAVAIMHLVWLTGSAQGEDPISESAREEAGVLARVHGVRRVPDMDIVFPRSGEARSGAIRNATITLHSPYGAVELETRHLASIEMDVGPNHFDRVTSVQRNLLLGFVHDRLDFVDASGAQSTLSKTDFRQIVFDVRPFETSLRTGSFLVLASGELMSGRIENWTLTGTGLPGATEPSIARDQVEWIQFLDGTTAVGIVSREGREMTGVFGERLVELRLDAGPEIEIPAVHVKAIFVRPGFLPQPVRRRFPADAAIESANALEPPGETPEGMVWIPPGAFVMGSPPGEPGRGSDEDPPTRVIVSRGFWMGKHEVTQGEFEMLMHSNPSGFPGDSMRPVEKVSWIEAREYCRRLTRQRAESGVLPANHVYRLPTEAEWEYACRAGSEARFGFGDDPTDSDLARHAWFLGNSGSSTHPVGELEPNRLGLHDMHGNVWEWCLDLWQDSYPGGTVTDYAGPVDGWLRVARGGSWLYDAEFCRSANRDNYGPENRCSDIGFRVVLAHDLD